MTGIKTKRTRITRKKSKIIRMVNIQERKEKIYKPNISIKCDPSSTLFIKSLPRYQDRYSQHTLKNEEKSFILQDDKMLIPTKIVNEENFGLIISTLKRQGKKWNISSVNDQKYFTITL